ncbi:mismatch-specific DNA-glycosylase [Nocardioides sp. MAHUQ-72]|uniref:mismatch-specific DNA-glycosylase n=1 Tax=unclassified Nocardioides TaxID=2615069 RepID=UPI0036127A71
MEVLPDIVGPRPRIVFCGMAGAQSRRSRDHYYETPGNAFWELLHDSGLTPTRLTPVDDGRLVEHGLGLTDLVRHPTEPPTYDVDELEAKLERWQPEWLAFTSKGVAHAAARVLGVRRPGLGIAHWELAGAQVFVLPGPSGANRRHDYDGRPDRLSWWRDLAGLAGDG